MGFWTGGQPKTRFTARRRMTVRASTVRESTLRRTIHVAAVVLSVFLFAAAALPAFPVSAVDAAVSPGGESSGPETAFFAEGYTGAGFNTFLCLANPSPEPAGTKVCFLFDNGAEEQRTYTIPPFGRHTVDAASEIGQGREFSMVVEGRCLAERSMYFTGPTDGGHCVEGVDEPSRTWYFAEGCTRDGFEEYVCVLNPGDSEATLDIRFQTPAGDMTVGDLPAVPPRSRATFTVNALVGPGQDVSLKLDAGEPVVAERSMYFRYRNRAGEQLEGGHCVFGATALESSYCFAEGTTRPGFEEWLTVQNPCDETLRVRAEYQPGGGEGPVVTEHRFPAHGRGTIDVARDAGEGRDVSVRLTGSSPFLAERPVYFSYGGGLGCRGGHCVVGSASTGTTWRFAEGFSGPGYHTWLCLQNPGGDESRVKIELLGAGGPAGQAEIVIPPESRETIRADELANGEFGTLITVLEGGGITAERCMYFTREDYDGGHAVLPGIPGRVLDGVCFSPYLHSDPTDGGRVSAEEVGLLLDTVSTRVEGIRTFCSTGDWEVVYRLAREKGLFVAGGCDLYDDRAYNEIELEGLVELASSGLVDIAVLGDETLLTGYLGEDELISYIRRVKRTGVPASTSDSWDMLLEHPRVVAECDIVIMNIHPYWEGVSLDDAVPYVEKRYRQVKQLAGAKRVIVETGWPSDGDVNGGAVPSAAAAAEYFARFKSWADCAGVDYFYFEAFDEPWKEKREGSVGPNWGMWDTDLNLKPGFEEVLDDKNGA